MTAKIPYLDLPAQIRGLRKELDAAIARTLDNCSFCLGPDVVQFEKDFARFIGAEHCVAFNSGTSALHIALMLLNVGQGDEVITTPFTFVATSWAISYVGAKPVYVDVEDGTMNLDPKLIERAITPKTKAIMPVHLYGQPFDIDPILAICRKHKLPLVEDAAQSHAAEIQGQNRRHVRRNFLLQFLSRQKSRRLRRRRRARDEQCGIRQTRTLIARTRLDRALLPRRSWFQLSHGRHSGRGAGREIAASAKMDH